MGLSIALGGRGNDGSRKGNGDYVPNGRFRTQFCKQQVVTATPRMAY